MSFFAINGWEIPVAAKDPETLNIIGEANPAANGNILETRRAQKERYSFTATALSRADKNAFTGIIAGLGHIWKFDSSLWSSKGLPATLTAGGGAVYGNGRFFASNSTDKAIQVTSVAGESLTIPSGVFYNCQKNQKWSVYMLFNPSAAQVSPGKTGYLLEIYIDANNYYRLLVAETGKAYAVVRSGGTNYAVQSADMPAMATGNWYYICLTADGEYLTLYSNGEAIIEGVDYVEPVGTPPTNVYIGCDHSAANHAGGLIDQLMIKPYVMSANEIAALYNLDVAPGNIPGMNVAGEYIGRSDSNPANFRGVFNGAKPYRTSEGVLYDVDFTIADNN